MATTKEQIRAGQTLVAKYKKQQHTCELVEHDGRLYFVLPKGRVFKSPLGGGQGGHRHDHQRLPLLVDPRQAAGGPASAPAGRTGCGTESHARPRLSTCFPSRGSRVRIPSPAPTSPPPVCEVPVARRHPGAGTRTTLRGRGSGTQATLVPVAGRHLAALPGPARWPLPVDDPVRSGGGRHAGGVGARGTAVSGGARGTRRSRERDRRRASLRRRAADGAHVAAALRGRRTPGARRP